MTNRDIAKKFQLLGHIMDLHDENTFKIRSYLNAYNVLRKLVDPISEMDLNELKSLQGVGAAIADKIEQLLTTGHIKTLDKYLEITPEGVVEMLGIRGLGPKKIKTIWKDLEITSPGELLLACNENRLVAAKGFGLKTQEDIRQKLEYHADSQGKFLYAHVIDEARKLLNTIQTKYPDAGAVLVGSLGVQEPIVEGIEILVKNISDIDKAAVGIAIDEESGKESFGAYPVSFFSGGNNIGLESIRLTSTSTFFSALKVDESQRFSSEEEVFQSSSFPWHPSFLRHANPLTTIPHIITAEDIKGIIHNHSTYSDGLHTLEEMAKKCLESGYEYFVISDHSKSAGYAQGLSIERVEMQWREIETLNQKLRPFKVFKSIESDILVDGSLDYPDDVLSGFDLVIASVHSSLNMDIDRATARLIKAIEHPATRILGHPTGRLLLGRKGYPLQWDKIMDACAANGVVIELNANPQRLDMDYSLIGPALDKGILISINPDAHSTSQIALVKYGVLAAQKAGLSPEQCLSAFTLEQFEHWLTSK